MYRYLDSTRTGPRYLAQEAVARAVVASVRRGVLLGHYELGAYAILANHVHVLLLPKISPSRLLQSLKGTTARQANLILGRTGEPFWQAESYDHWVRDDSEWQRIAAYIEENPVKAGLVHRASDYRWSSAWVGNESAETSLRQTQVSAPRERSTSSHSPGTPLLPPAGWAKARSCDLPTENIAAPRRISRARRDPRNRAP